MTIPAMADEDASETAPVEVVCDESGSDGENLFESRHRVFAHGSVDLEASEASEIVAKIRKTFRVRGDELKSTALLNDRQFADVVLLYASGGPLHGHSHVYLLDKLYFAVSKVIDLLVEEEAYDRGLKLHEDGSARALASVLFQHGRQALGTPNWDRLLGAFVSLVRRRQRKGAKVTLDEFYAVIDDVRLKSHRKDVTAVLAMTWESRRQAAHYESSGLAALDLPNLEPLIVALLPVAEHWATVRAAPVALVHDRQTILTDEILRFVVAIANNPHPEFAYNVPLASVTQVDSKSDPRVQLADLTAGLGRRAGELALNGTLDSDLASAIRPMVNPNSIWDDEPSWFALVGRSVGQ
ncbi:MAG: DUF3800 domain-containing protein [Cellulomonas sp.]|uniref:DUF3800 domain-containing protein n=1 Tax=Cellulomonas sp. TaxID=40001 RepID=UPI002587930E|nr:DUF3800 domain-containing protein [Cellulomonas sp.]MCR6706201.1 DUF3800 domain-containing protein [Cellulomonas sp.]